MTSRDSRGRRHAHDDTDPRTYFRSEDSRKFTRKDRQLCGQVQRALSSALGADFYDEVLQELWVVKVEPAPTASRLLVWVAGPKGADTELILARLSGVAKALRAEVAQAIHRKQVPTLSFAICDGEEAEVEP
jgi:ribosome-binding factor A